MTDDLKDLLCPLGFADRIAKCDDLLAAGIGEPNRLARVLYFKAHALRNMGKPVQAISVCETALSNNPPAEHKAKFLECKAMCLYDRGRLAELRRWLDGPCAELAGTAPSIAAHFQALRGCLMSYALDPMAFEFFAHAEVVFRQTENGFSESWVQTAAAALALKLGDRKLAASWAEKVTYAPAIALARLLQAEALYRDGHSQESEDMLAAVVAGQYGAPGPTDRARIHYLNALFALDTGDVVHASRELIRATECLSEQSRHEVDLVDAINSLGLRLRGGEVA